MPAWARDLAPVLPDPTGQIIAVLRVDLLVVPQPFTLGGRWRELRRGFPESELPAPIVLLRGVEGFLHPLGSFDQQLVCSQLVV